MLLLVTDTSGKNGSVALARAGEAMPAGEVLVIENVPLAGGTFSAQLVPQIAALLAKHGFKKADIGAFIVVSGPGSFTGLRVGLAAIKGLAEILGKPIVPVSLLELIALASGNEGKVLSALDAGRGEVYAGEYETTGEVAHVLREQLIPKSDLLSAGVSSLISTPDATLAGLVRDAGLKVFKIEAISVQMIAQLGWRKWRDGETVTPEQLEANYIRRTDAEIFAKTSS
jgi:tRNA threonylcarbamoyladenosine biosynthesis protein TsaB